MGAGGWVAAAAAWGWLAATAGALSAARGTSKLPRLWLGDDVAATEGSRWELSAAQHRYLSTVMRLRVGDEVRCFGAAMGEWVGTVAASDRKGTTVAASRSTRPPRSAPSSGERLELYFAPLRKKRTSLLIEKAVELGVTRLVPVKTSRTERSAVGAIAPGVHATAVEAAEQSERLDVPLLEAVVDVAADGLGGDVPLFVCAERSDEAAPGLLDALVARADETRRRGVALLVGPEGGFSDADLDAVRAARPDAVFVSLGTAVLRAETACWAGLAVASAARARSTTP